MLALTRNKKAVDLLPSTNLVMEYQNPLFDPLGKPAKSFSYGFDLPATSRNRLAFGFPESLHTRNNLAVGNGELFYNGVKFLEGDVVPTKARNDSFRVNMQANKRLEWAELGIDQHEARNSGAITLHEPEMVFSLYTDIYPIINDALEPLTQCEQLNLKETLQWVANQNNWSVAFSWDAIFDELYLLAPSLNNASTPRGTLFDGDVNRKKLASFYDILFNLQKLLGLYIVFDYNLQTVSVSMLKDVLTFTDTPLNRVAGEYEKEYNATNEGLQLRFGESEQIRSDDFDFLYGEYNTEGEEVETDCFLLPQNADGRLVFNGFVPGFSVGGRSIERQRGTEAREYDIPIAIYFKTSATAGSYISTGGQSLELPELGPVYWAKYISLFQNSEIIKRKVYLDFNQLNSLSPTRAFYIEGNRYLYSKLSVQIPNRPVKYFEAEAVLLRID